MLAKQLTCLECGEPYVRRTLAQGFCSPSHRKAFHNRRATRSAALYDLFMALRHDRETASDAQVWKLMCRLAADYRADDMKDRAGRRSWTPLGHRDHVLNRLAYLRADTLVSGRR